MTSECRKLPSGTYLVLSSDGMPGAHDYRIEMLKNNHIPGLMSCKVSMEEGRTLLHYDITGRQTLATLFAKKMLGEEQVRDVIKGICRVFDSCVMYMLDVGGLLFSEDYIYMNLDDGSMEFAYVPEFCEDGYGAVHTLAEFLIGRVDHRDKKATRLAYDLFETSNKDDYTLEEIRKILRHDEEVIPVSETTAFSLKPGVGDRALSGKSASVAEDRDKDGFSFATEMVSGITDSSPETESRKDKRKETKKRLKNNKAAVKVKRKKSPGDIAIWIITGLVVGWIVYDMVLRKYGLWLTVTLGAAGLAGIVAAVIFYMKKRRSDGKAGKAKKKKRPKKRNKEGRKSPVADCLPEPVILTKPVEVAGFIESEEKEDLSDRTTILARRTPGYPSLVPADGLGLPGIDITADTFVLGKSLEYADGQIDNEYVSRVHCRIEKCGEDYYLEDLNSTNGTLINGTRINPGQKIKLKNNDIIGIGHARFVFSYLSIAMGLQHIV